MALIARGVEQCGKPLRMDHRLVFAAVEGEGGKLGGALFGETQRRAFLRRKRGSVRAATNPPLGARLSGWS